MRNLQCLFRFGVVFVVLVSMASYAEDRPPNVVVILTDDLGIGDIGPYGNTLIKTPHLDRMATEGAVLENFYAAANVCTPSRGGLLTGRYPVRLGLTRDVARPTNDIGIDPSEKTIGELLQEVGYATACIGKWHLGHAEHQWPTANGFDYYYGLPYSNDMTPLALYRMSEAIEEPVDQTTITERLTHEAVGFMEDHADEPFFVYLAHPMPHVPLYVSERFEGQSEAGLYGDVIESIDWSVGEVLSALERLGVAENTLVLFTSDNGPWWEGSAGAHRNRKGSSWEGGMRVPLLAWWPGTVPAGVSRHGVSMAIDFLPTIANMANAPVPTNRAIDGRDMMPLLLGETESIHEYLLLYDSSQIAAVRSGHWKLVVQSRYRNWNAPIGGENYYYYPGLLFDLSEGGQELYSVTREHPEVAKRLRAWLDADRKTIRKEQY